MVQRYNVIFKNDTFRRRIFIFSVGNYHYSAPAPAIGRVLSHGFPIGRVGRKHSLLAEKHDVKRRKWGERLGVLRKCY